MDEEALRHPHQLRRADVSAWLANSVVNEITYHRTSVEAADIIRERGASVEASRIASFGQGIYTATETDPLYGSVEVAVAIRTLHPLAGLLDDVSAVIDDIARIARPRDARGTPSLAAEIRLTLLDLGYDGIVVWDGGGDGVHYVIAITNDSIKVVIDS